MMTDLTISKTTLRRYRHNFQRIYDFRQHVAPPTFDYEAPVAEDRVPNAWQPIGPTSEEEVVFLAPLDIVSARGRAKWLFDFEYIWEVYKPASARRWGYYTLPILYGDRLVARLDPKLDRKTGTLVINGFWLEEEEVTAADVDFAEALARGLDHFARFLQAGRIDTAALQPASLRQHLAARITTHSET